MLIFLTDIVSESKAPASMQNPFFILSPNTINAIIKYFFYLIMNLETETNLFAVITIFFTKKSPVKDHEKTLLSHTQQKTIELEIVSSYFIVKSSVLQRIELNTKIYLVKVQLILSFGKIYHIPMDNSNMTENPEKQTAWICRLDPPMIL